MEINVIDHDFSPEADRGFTISMVIKSFKGRKDVEVHLFRPEWTEEEEKSYPWEKMLGQPMDPSLPMDPETSRKVYMETFTAGERDRIIAFLQEQYADRVSVISAQPIPFPIPMGLPALSSVPEGKNVGVIRFSKIPSYTLDIPLHGLFDLSQHEPIVQNGG